MTKMGNQDLKSIASVNAYQIKSMLKYVLKNPASVTVEISRDGKEIKLSSTIILRQDNATTDVFIGANQYDIDQNLANEVYRKMKARIH